jgi:carboxypeptidase C (cathepsin A)
MHTIRCLFAAVLLGVLTFHAQGQGPASPDAAKATDRDSLQGAPRLPPDQTTHHSLELAGRTLRFAATAGTIRLSNDEAMPRADVAFVAYQLDGADRRTRPVAFIFNGGP